MHICVPCAQNPTKYTNVSTPILSGEFILAARWFFFKFLFLFGLSVFGPNTVRVLFTFSAVLGTGSSGFFTDRFLCWRCVRPVAGPCPCPCPCPFVRFHTRNGTTYLHFIGRHFSEYTHRKLINEPGIRRMLMMFEWLCRRSMASHGHGHGVLKMQTQK